MRKPSWAVAALAVAMAGIVWGTSGCTQAILTPADSPDSSKGVVYLSLTRSGSVEPSIWLKLRGVGNGYSSRVVLDDAKVTRDWTQVTTTAPAFLRETASREDPVGYLAAIALPPGNYEFYGWYGTSPIWSRPGDDYDIFSQSFSVKFTVKAGVVTYAGSLQVIVPNSIIADHRQGSFELAVNDRHARDAALLKQKYPKLGALPESTGLMALASAGGPMTYFVFPSSGPTRNGNGGFN